MAQTRLLNVLQSAIASAKAGDRRAARALLEEVTRGEPENEVAWLWLASVAETPDEAVGHLQRVLAINPANERAREGLAHFLGRPALGSTPAPAGWQCPLCLAAAREPQDRCPSCRAVLTLADPGAFVGGEGADQGAVAAAVARLTARVGEGADPATLRWLGFGYLNLHSFDEGLRHLQEALRLAPDKALKARLNALRKWRKARESARGRPAHRAARPRTILVVDDSPAIRRVVTLALERAGHAVASASDGTEALERVRSGQVPDLVFLDINMPGPDGYQVCKRLREQPGAARVPVVMLSGRDGFFSKVRGRLAGCSGFLSKPFKLDDLLGAVEAYCPG